VLTGGDRELLEEARQLHARLSAPRRRRDDQA
jgi:hypothetical protein